MSTTNAVAAAPAGGFADKAVTFTPLGETEQITLTPAMIRSHIAVKTRSGKVPSDSDLIKFLMLCKSGNLNPWTNDAYLVGYDSKDGPVFTKITAQQALLKRAENCKAYRGMESGVVVQTKSGDIVERMGDLKLKDDILLGGWAKVHRSDRDVPSSDRLDLSVYSTGRSRWKVDPAGMIVKCTEASALRKAFPLELGSMYTQGEFDRVVEVAEAEQPQPINIAAEATARLSSLSQTKTTPTQSLVVDASTVAPAVEAPAEPDPGESEEINKAQQFVEQARAAEEAKGATDEAKPDPAYAEERFSKAQTMGELDELFNQMVADGHAEAFVDELYDKAARRIEGVE